MVCQKAGPSLGHGMNKSGGSRNGTGAVALTTAISCGEKRAKRAFMTASVVAVEKAVSSAIGNQFTSLAAS